MAKRYSPKLKFQIVLELLQSDKTLEQVAKVYGVHPGVSISWGGMDNHELFRHEPTGCFAYDTNCH